MTDSHTLKNTYQKALKSLGKISKLTIRPDTNEYQSCVSAAALDLLRAQRMVSNLSLFSSNESLEDIQTLDIKYLAIEYLLATVAERRQPLNKSDPESKNDTISRLDTVKAAIEYYFEFLKTLNNYGLLTKDMSSSLSSASTGSAPGGTMPLIPKRLADKIATGKVTLRDLQSTDAATRRAEKIEQFRRGKFIEQAIKAIEERRKSEQLRVNRHKLHTTEPTLDSKSEEEEDYSDDDYTGVDEDTVRTLEFAKLQLMALKSLGSLETLNMELEMVSRMPSAAQLQLEQQEQLAQVNNDSRDRHNRGEGSNALFDKGFTERVEPKLYPKGLGQGPLLTSDGKVNRPFTIVGNLAQKVERDQIMKRVQGTGQYAPTMTVEEFLDEELRRGNIISGGGPSKEPIDGEDEEIPEKEHIDTIDGYKRSDEQTVKDREWDEFVEAVPKGSGNTINRG